MKTKPKTTQPLWIPDSKPVFTSGIVCQLLGIPVWVLKQLDRENVVRPSRRRGGFRIYSKREVERLETIWYYMKVKKVNVHGVKIILEIQEKKAGGG